MRTNPIHAAGAVLVLWLAAAVPVQAATPNAGSWKGETDQGASIAFDVSKHDGKRFVKHVEIRRVETTCHNVATGTDYEKTFKDNEFRGYKMKVRSSGEFSLDYTGYDNWMLGGHFSSKKRVSGTFKAEISHSSEVCESGKVAWTARLR